MPQSLRLSKLRSHRLTLSNFPGPNSSRGLSLEKFILPYWILHVNVKPRSRHRIASTFSIQSDWDWCREKDGIPFFQSGLRSGLNPLSQSNPVAKTCGERDSMLNVQHFKKNWIQSNPLFQSMCRTRKWIIIESSFSSIPILFLSQT